VSRRELRRVLVLAPGPLDERLAGPEIRAVEFARALSTDYEVTLAAHRPAGGELDGMPIVSSRRRRLLEEVSRQDAILSACLPPYLLALKSVHGFAAIADRYDPHELELATLDAGRRLNHELRSRASIRALQLRYADVVLCAAERQREEIISAARLLVRPGAPLPDPVVVPFGIPNPPPPSVCRPLREHFPQIAASDTLVLWWGSVWRWLDAETAVRAFARIAASRSDVKLVITAGKPPSKRAGQMFDTVEEVRALADELGVLGSSVLFYDEWIPYERRHDYLRDADIGLTLHRHAAEAQLAARVRYMDYLSAELPCVLGRGDETAEELIGAGFATAVDAPGPEELAAILLGLADDPTALADARSAGHRLAGERHWSAVGERLREAVARARPGEPTPLRDSLALAAGAAGYYAGRLVARVDPAPA
jgi:glycosyltransferase involved in cell wall biosynthesis